MLFIKKKKTTTKRAGNLEKGDHVVYPSGVGKVTQHEIVKTIDAMSSALVAIFRLHMLSGPHKGKEMRESLATHDEVVILKKEKPDKRFTILDIFKYGAGFSLIGASVTILLTIII